MILRGKIKNSAPVIGASVRGGVLHIGGPSACELTIDTGFNGAVAVPKEIARKLNLQFLAIDSITLGTGVELEVPPYVGKVRVGGRTVETWFLVGDSLIGMELIEEICSEVHIDLDRQTVSLALRVP